MPRRCFPFTVAGLMILVAILGIELAALRTPSYLGDTLAFNLAAAVLIAATFAARFGPESSNAFWFGFAVLGWSQFILGMLLLEINYSGTGKLPTNLITIELMNWAIPRTIAIGNPNDNRRFENLDEVMRNHRSYDIRFLYQKANAVVSIGVAVLGGSIAQMLSFSSERKRPTDTSRK